MTDKIIENKDKNEEIPGMGTKKRKTTDEDQYRVVISGETNGVLEKLVEQVNNGFDGGDVTKSDIAQWIFINTSKSFSEADVRTIRSLHFDESKMLRTLLVNKGSDAHLPEDIRRAIRSHFGVSEQPKKRSVPQRMESSSRKDSSTDAQAASNDPVEVMNSTESQARRITKRS
jgi:hypothetical protein